MPDVLVTVPARLWQTWLDEGDLPGHRWSGFESHFWVGHPPAISPGERVYIVALGKLRGYAPLVRIEDPCLLRPERSCLVRRALAVAVTIDEAIKGARGFRYRWWDRSAERPFEDWRI